ncbi:MAG TPA: penicillin-binding protein 1C, partial [Candidatus Binatia bacterium]|nr:penicillin-binding protein 1C [Candidatus Binatia bacterium]
MASPSYLVAALPSYAAVKQKRTVSEALLLDRHGEVIHELRVDPTGRRLEWKTLGEISPTLVKAVIQSEDRRFHEHRGVDWLALGSSFVTNLFSTHPRGASTISMQLTSILQGRRAQARRDWREKWRQIQDAREIERSWTKNEILEAYLNLISYRGELQGVAAASQGLFAKEAHGLDDADSWILASLIRSPNATAEKVAARACALGRSLQTLSDCALLQARIGTVLAPRLAIKPRANLAPHVAEKLLGSLQYDGAGTRSVTSTLDGKLQRFATDVLREQILALKAQNVSDGAVLVVENRTGEILAYVGNSGELASARFVDGVRAPRQAGSTLKPFLYGLAFEQRLLTPSSLLDDSAMDIADPRGIYRPRNYDERYQGLVTARAALASSLNIPAVKTLGLVGTETFLRKLRELSFGGLTEDQDFYGPSLALGSADVTLWNLVNAYRSFANGGRWSEISYLAGKQVTERRVFSEEGAFLVSSILSDRESRSLTFGLEGPLATRFWSAVKTGTSKEMRDNWCVGYSSKYTVGVWVGNFSGAPMWNVSGMSGAAPIWLEVMNWLHRTEPSHPPKIPAGIVEKSVNQPAQRSERREWFVRGTEPIIQKVAAPQLHHKIIYPADGTVMALDPDIPSSRQKVFLEAKPADKSFRWLLDEVVIGHAGATVSWSPRVGSHSLTLVDGDNRVVDRITFSVRGRIGDLSQEAGFSDRSL